jgi:hypothetical protein
MTMSPFTTPRPRTASANEMWIARIHFGNLVGTQSALDVFAICVEAP